MRRCKALLEDIGGVSVLGYRAPTFSVGSRNPWVHATLAEEGYRYSSSVYPIAHDLYGVPDAPRHPFCPQPGFVEIPLTTVRIFGRNLPTAGGGYFRLLPYRLTRRALRKAGRDLRTPSVFYIHPWEIDPGQPRQSQAPRLSRFRHYLNLGRTEGRLRRLLHDFSWARMDRVFLDPAQLPIVSADQIMADDPQTQSVTVRAFKSGDEKHAGMRLLGPCPARPSFTFPAGSRSSRPPSGIAPTI